MSLTALSALVTAGALSLLFALPVSSQEVPPEEVPPEEEVPAPAAPLIPITVLLFGQSNMSGITGPCPYSLQNEHIEATVYDGTFTAGVANPLGAPLTEYARLVGPECFLVDELLNLGYDPTIIIRAVAGSNVDTSRNILVPALAADVLALNLQPDAIFSWQGEADARTESLAYVYDDRLVGPYGPTGKESVMGQIRELFAADLPWYVAALRVREDDYAPYHHIVRSAHYVAGTHPNVCTVETFDAPLLPGDNQPHVDLVGLEIVGRRVAQSIADSFLCP